MNRRFEDIDGLIEADDLTRPIDASGFSPQTLSSFLERMVLIRETEHKAARGREEGAIGGPVHLGVGQEAIAVGVSASIKASDFVYGAHRSHAHLLALDPDVFKLFSELF